MNGLRTPTSDGFSMPPEWAPHERCVMAWPCRTTMWGRVLGAAKAEVAATAQAIARFEPVLMVTPPGAEAEAAAACGSDVDVTAWAIDDSWTRDIGAVVVTDERGQRRGVDFVFNSWGGKFVPFDQDARFAERMCAHLDLPRYDAAPMVLEGGAISVDGAGALLTTEQCLLHPNRNPALTPAQIEDGLRTWLGIHEVVWLPFGLVEDDDTDGHVDNVAAFVAPRVVVAQTTADAANPNHRRLRANVERLAGAGFEVRELDVLPYTTIDGCEVVVPPTNLYQAGAHGVVVPVVDGPDGGRALEAVARLLPDREVVGVPGAALAFGGGGVHCITQQVPA